MIRLLRNARRRLIFGAGANLAFLKSAARALIYWEKGRADDARINADMAVRFGNIRRNGLVLTFDANVIGFDDKPALKRLLAILKRV